MAEDLYRRKLINYFKKNISKGYAQETLKWALVNQGYSRIVVENALEDANKELAKSAPILKEKPQITHQIIDEYDNPVIIKKSWWKRLLE